MSVVKKVVTVTGRVQGVGYRMFAAQKAKGLELMGRVWNEADGSVRLEVQGKMNLVQRYIHELSRGPFLSNVEAVETANGTFDDYSDFRIL
jgi:acylphosphatase